MQGGKKPNRAQRKVLNANGYDANDWLYIKMKGNDTLIFKNRETSEIIELAMSD